jgi:3D (Asp-Asp-Asp) domain-containing protein
LLESEVDDINEQDNSTERINQMAQGSAMSLLRWAKNQGGRLLKLALKKIMPAILSYLAPMAIPIIASLVAFIFIYAAIFILPRWIMGGGSGPINQNTVGVLQVTVTGYTTGSTATGVAPTTGVVAVDPSVIAYGTRMYIPGYGNGIALDSSLAKGDNIAVYFSDPKAAKSYGSRSETIELLGMGAIPTTTSGVNNSSGTGNLDILSYGNSDTSWPLSKDQSLYSTYLGLDSAWLNNYQSEDELSGVAPDSTSGNAPSPLGTVGSIWAQWMSQIPSQSDQAYPYIIPWSMMAAMDKIAGEQNFIGTNVPGSEGDGRVTSPSIEKKHFDDLSSTLTWQSFTLTYEHDWTVTVTDSKGNTTLKAYTEEHTKSIKLLTSATCYDANYAYTWAPQPISIPSSSPRGGYNNLKVTVPQVTLVTRTGPYYQKLKTVLSQPEYGLTSEMDLQLVIQCAQSLDQAYMIDSWLFGTPLEMTMNSENGTGLTGRFQFTPVANAPILIPYGFHYDNELKKLVMNPGVDLMTAYGDPVVSVAGGPTPGSDGTVVYVGTYGSDGNAVMINDGNCRTLYANLATFAVSVGQQVAAGQTIGTVGMPYLHFEVRTGNGDTEYLNPADYLPTMVWSIADQIPVNPTSLKYRDVNKTAILEFLQGWDSMLAKPSDVQDIINGAQAYDINPLALIAITGDETTFCDEEVYPPTGAYEGVPNSLMEFNPYNVSIPGGGHGGNGDYAYGGCTLADSSGDAAYVVAGRLTGVPPPLTPPVNGDAFVWINTPPPTNPNGNRQDASGQAYSGTPAWGSNVNGWFHTLEAIPGIYQSS